jgi:hypothetical protein
MYSSLFLQDLAVIYVTERRGYFPRFAQGRRGRYRFRSVAELICAKSMKHHDFHGGAFNSKSCGFVCNPPSNFFCNLFSVILKLLGNQLLSSFSSPYIICTKAFAHKKHKTMPCPWKPALMKTPSIFGSSSTKGKPSDEYPSAILEYYRMVVYSVSYP